MDEELRQYDKYPFIREFYANACYVRHNTKYI